jgi:cell division protein FtsA
MTQTNYIVAIDLGTSHLVGMVGRKNTNGTIAILAEETEPAGSCIRRGCIYNVDETALQIKRLIRKLQNKLSDKLTDPQINKVYIGVGGQSLRSIEHSEVKIINTDAVISEDDIEMLDNQCRAYQPELLNVLSISPPAYYLDDVLAVNPVGISCKRIEARYQLIVGRPSIRKQIAGSIERSNVKLAGIIVSPLAMADAILSRDEKELGCAFVNLGAGVTSVAVYTGGKLIHLSVIPMGGNLITKDLTTLHLVEAEAERLKITYGNALTDKNKDGTISIEMTDGAGVREISLNEVNTVIEARVKEIVENVYARVKETGVMDSLGAGIVLAGGASVLKNLQEVIRDKFEQDVRYSNIRKKYIEGHDENLVGRQEYMTAISLLIKGTENGVSYTEKEETVETEETKTEPKPKKNLLRHMKDKAQNMAKGLFDE